MSVFTTKQQTQRAGTICNVYDIFISTNKWNMVDAQQIFDQRIDDFSFKLGIKYKFKLLDKW
jgi:hypothetical protein